jgi:diguanylate cyclase (GGDEF)-like protein
MLLASACPEVIRMADIGLGLLNRELVKKIKERWRHGDVAVLFLRLSLPETDARIPLARWEKEQKLLFWRQKLGPDYVYFLSGSSKKTDIQDLVKQAAQSLRGYVAAACWQSDRQEASHQEGSDCLRIGVSIARRHSSESSEAVVFRALLEAMEHDETGVLPGMTKPENGLAKAYEANHPAAATHEIDYPRTVFGAFPIGKLAAPIRQLDDQSRVSEASELFDAEPDVYGVVIVKDRVPVGLLMREKLYQLLAGQYGLSLYWNRSVAKIMDAEPLIVDERMPVEQVSQLAMTRNFSRMYDIVIITSGGEMIGATSIRDLLECMTTLRTEEARTANPLTGLPGNEGIQFELQRRISTGQPMAIVYADLDYFKWFNDCFGFGLGDELIRFLAELMGAAFKGGADPGAFVGHIGGDDFIAILDPGLAEEACAGLIERYDREVQAFYGDGEVRTVEDRHGNAVQQQGVTLSLSLMVWNATAPLSPSGISKAAAKLKKKAKAVRGSSYVKELLDDSQPQRNEGHT